MKFGAWNIRTLNDRTTAIRRTALIGLELKKYNIDVAGLSETRFSESGMLRESISGYTYYWSGLAESEKRLHGVGIVMKNGIADRMNSSPKSINGRLMTARISLPQDKHLTIISAYAPTMTHEDWVKETFYADLDRTLTEVPATEKLVLLGDFNARVGKDYMVWPDQLGKFGIG